MLKTYFIVLIFTLLLSGCGVIWEVRTESTNPVYDSNERTVTERTSRPKKKNRDKNNQPKEALLAVYREWKGVPYQLGGSTKSGIDCSAFTQQTYKKAFNKSIARTTIDKFKAGSAIERKQLLVGDLILFETKADTRHVGIYIGNSQFLHASVTYGVSIADLNNPYWRRRYVGARRIL